MKVIGPNEIMEIRKNFMKQNKMPIKIFFPATKYDCTNVWKSESAVPGRIFGIEIVECLHTSDMIVIYKTSETYNYE